MQLLEQSGEQAGGQAGGQAGSSWHRRLTAVRAWLAGLTGWRRPAVLGGLGVMAALALPPLYLLPLLFLAFTGLLWTLEDGSSAGNAFSAGWWFGFGFSAAGLSWIGSAFVVDAPQHGWMAPFAIAGMAAGMALFPAAAAALSRLIFDRRPLFGTGRVLVFASLWTMTEWMRGWVLTGFPWNLIGTVWTASDAMIQVAAVTGVYGLSLLTVAVASVPAVLATPDQKTNSGWIPLVLAFAILGVVWAGGQARLAGASEKTVPGVQLRLVQPSIPQALKWKPDLRLGHVQKQLKMSRAPSRGAAGPAPTHIIWAETSVPFVLTRAPGLIRALAEAAPPGGLIIAGAPRATPPGVNPARIWNSLHAIDSKGRIRGTYDKFHLVPFGEYVPLRGLVPADLFEKLTAGRQDFSSGPGLRTLDIPGLPPFSPLICYEVIFPGQVVDRKNRPQWILNLTNDAWFGRTSGPYQHFAAARLRAVEEGLPLVRVANTGISGVIDGYGRTVRQLGLGQVGVLDSPLPAAHSERTPFSRFGNRMMAVIIIISMGIGFLLAPHKGNMR